MEAKHITLSVIDRIAVLTIQRPKALNAINAGVMEELDYYFTEGGLPDDVLGVVLTGSGEKSFVAGADITEFTSLDVSGGTKKSSYGHGVFSKIENYRRPVVAAVNGYALGAGNELAMSCHIRICSDNARFGLPEVTLGLIPGYGGTQRLLQIIGKGRAMEMMLTGDMIDAQKALNYGLVTDVVEQSQLIETATSLLKKISNKGPNAISKVIKSVNAYYDKNMNGFVKEQVLFGEAMGSDESTEGVSAFLEKRKPEF